MDSSNELEKLRVSLEQAEKVQLELDQRVFHLKTLYDISRDIFASVESSRILRDFLLMTMGNFGVTDGFIMTVEVSSNEVSCFVPVGLQDTDTSLLKLKVKEFLSPHGKEWSNQRESVCIHPDFLPGEIACALPFVMENNSAGLLGLGAKVVGEPFDEHDKELLVTLVNNLLIALKNARSFEEINRLNQDLHARNAQLESAYNRLSAAMRKVETLESIKASLSKFVPTAVCRLIERSPTGAFLERKEQDVSILFLDIEGYTKICEQLSAVEVNEIIEKCFSAIMEAIHASGGDVTETAGDGLMVLFLDEDEKVNAVAAVQTAVTIRERMAQIRNDFTALSSPLIINVGIHSGLALVGAAKFESVTGSRWNYTARGTTTNVAARIGSLASGGKILLSRTTAARVEGHFSFTSLGKFKLKNVSEEMEVFAA